MTHDHIQCPNKRLKHRDLCIIYLLRGIGNANDQRGSYNTTCQGSVI